MSFFDKFFRNIDEYILLLYLQGFVQWGQQKGKVIQNEKV